MSNLDPEKQYDKLSDALDFVFYQMMKDIFISIPGIIESYNPVTKRCRVVPAINLRLTDGTISTPSAIENVPVLWPGGGGFVFISPLPSGSPVEIKFSQRGITKFKETFGKEDPGPGMFDKSDAHVVPGYGALEISPATQSGCSMQDDAGENYIFVEDGNIEVNSKDTIFITSSTSIEIESPDNTIVGPLVVNGLLTADSGISSGGSMSLSGIISGASVFAGKDSDKHIHTGVVPGGGSSGVPI